MRFKAKLASEQISLLYSLVVSIARLTSSTSSSNSGGDGGTTNPTYGLSSSSSSTLVRHGCMLFLDNDYVRFSVRGGHRSDATGVTCFVELQARSDGTGNAIFVEHRIESIADNNGILMELDIVQLRMALQSIQQQEMYRNNNNSSRSRNNNSSMMLSSHLPSFVVMKLAKRNNSPCLCLDVATPGRSMEVHHTIPVRMSRASEMMQHHLLPPELPMPNIQLEFEAQAAPLRIVLERLRLISPTVYLTAQSPTGQLTISTHSTTNGVSIQTILDRLVPCMESCRKQNTTNHNIGYDDQDNEEVVECTVKVDTKKLALCLQWQQSSSNLMVSTALLCWIENEALVLHVILNPSNIGFFTYYIPVHFLSPEDGDNDINNNNNNDLVNH